VAGQKSAVLHLAPPYLAPNTSDPRNVCIYCTVFRAHPGTWSSIGGCFPPVGWATHPPISMPANAPADASASPRHRVQRGMNRQEIPQKALQLTSTKDPARKGSNVDSTHLQARSCAARTKSTKQLPHDAIKTAIKRASSSRRLAMERNNEALAAMCLR